MAGGVTSGEPQTTLGRGGAPRSVCSLPRLGLFRGVESYCLPIKLISFTKAIRWARSAFM